MKRFLISTGAAVCVAAAWTASAHDVPAPDGHIPPNVNYGFEVIGRDVLAGEITGLYTDVWSHEGYAYIGTFQDPACTRAGVFVVDIEQAIANHAAGVESGAVVAEIKSAPNTRVNDVKVHTIAWQNKERDVLVATEEECGSLTGSGKRQIGKGGISYYDVTDPTKPHPIKQHAIGEDGVHNTFTWTADDGRSYQIGVDDVALDDVIIIDVSKPQSPKEIGRVGIGSWLDGGYPQITDDGQLFTGVFAAPLLHDVWVEKIGGRWQAVLSYWDAGFVILDVTDPNAPEVLGDTTYPDPDPIYGTSPAEGNGHAAVFGGDAGQYLFAGDEDFDPYRTQTIDADGDGFLATQGSDVPQVTPEFSVTGTGVYVGRACSAIDQAPTDDAIAIVERGDCAFTTKAGNAEAAGYGGVVVFNQSERPDGNGCEGTVSMIVAAGIPALFVPRSAGFELIGLGGYDPSTCDSASPDNGDALLAGYGEGTPAGQVTLEATFDGWGYLHVINNATSPVSTAVPATGPYAGLPPDQRQDLLGVDYLGELGYFAPAELTVGDPAFISGDPEDPNDAGAGDLTMHNVEADPLTAGDVPTFDSGPRMFVSWYSLGMRAMEYRPGHWHTGNGDVYSWNVHEVGRYIAEDGSNFWGVHLDTRDGDAGEEQIILGSDRNTGLWIFTFDCVDEVVDPRTGEVRPDLYCRRGDAAGEGG